MGGRNLPKGKKEMGGGRVKIPTPLSGMWTPLGALPPPGVLEKFHVLSEHIC